MIKFLQINTNRSKEAHALLMQTIAEKSIDVVIVSKPNKKNSTVRSELVYGQKKGCRNKSDKQIGEGG